MSDENIHQIDIPIPPKAVVTHSITVTAMLNEDGEAELCVATRGNATLTSYLGLLTWGQFDLYGWENK